MYFFCEHVLSQYFTLWIRIIHYINVLLYYVSNKQVCFDNCVVWDETRVFFRFCTLQHMCWICSLGCVCSFRNRNTLMQNKRLIGSWRSSRTLPPENPLGTGASRWQNQKRFQNPDQQHESVNLAGKKGRPPAASWSMRAKDWWDRVYQIHFW